MQRAIYFEEAYQKGILSQITEGYIFSLSTPDSTDVERKMDPILLQMVSYAGLKSIIPLGTGVKFQAQGKRMYCMLEPSSFSNKHVEPISRQHNTTACIPYRFDECEIFFTKDAKYRILIPKKSHETFDSFVIDFPEKGDICVLYYIFDKDNVNNVVIPFIEENITFILKWYLNITNSDAQNVANKFMNIVNQFHEW